MTILFLTISRFNSIEDRGIYSDLMRCFRDEGHDVCIVSPLERRFRQPSGLDESGGVRLLRVRTLNNQKTNFVEKGLSTLLIGGQFARGIKKHFHGVRFDLVLYSTPPITFTSLVKRIKRRHEAKSYLLLKDIFPQNAVDIGMMRRGSPLHRYFRRREKNLYAVSDHIGCMSPANAEYVPANNPAVDRACVEVCPNSVQLSVEKPVTPQERAAIRQKYGIPADDGITVFIYGGNLGKPQGLDFLPEVLEANRNNSRSYFLIVGSGTEYGRLEAWFVANPTPNAKLMRALPKEEYDTLTKACDVGLIFLDRRFTIPNYPSRLLSYMENRMPVIAATDRSTDIGRIAEANGYGFWCENGDTAAFVRLVERLSGNRKLIGEMGNKAYEYLLDNYLVENSYRIIMKHIHENH